jgi:uracil-DNA glycosylase
VTKSANRTELEELRRELEECVECPLSVTSPMVVFGEGNPDSLLAVVGEGPGEREEAEGRPFVGRAGQLLERIMSEVSLSRDEIWLTNVLKRRASKVVEGRVKNRLPRAEELAFYKQYLDRELKIVSPRVVLCLGNLAANVQIHRNFRMTQEHGQWFAGPSGKRLMATYHPAYILRLEGNDFNRVLNEAIEDFGLAVAEYRSLVATR